MAKTNPLGFRLEPRIKEALVAAAHDDRRSVSSLVEIVIERWLTEKGYLEPEQQVTPLRRVV